MATNRKQPQRRQGGEPRHTDLNPLKLPPDTRKRQEGWTDSDEPMGEDLPDEPARSPSSAVRYRQPSESLRGLGEQDDGPDTTRQIPTPPRRTSQAYSGLPGQMRGTRRAQYNHRYSTATNAEKNTHESIHALVIVCRRRYDSGVSPVVNSFLGAGVGSRKIQRCHVWLPTILPDRRGSWT